MKKIKLLIILLLVVFLSGCKGEYNLKINEDLSIKETVNLSIENENDLYDKTIKLFEDNNIDDSLYKVSQTNDYINVQYSEEFNNFEDYFLNSKFYSQFFSSEKFKKDNKKISYRSTAKLKLDDNSNDSKLNNSFNISDLKIKVTSPFNIRENNADKIDGKTLIWNLSNKDTYKEINFIYEYLRKTNLYMIIILLCIGIVSISGFVLIRNYLKERKL